MKAIVYTERGPPPVFKQIDIEIPVPKDDEVLIKIHAASINSWDWELMRYKPSRVSLGKLSDPRYKILGVDIAGIVKSTGKNVSQFKPGDAVFGDICNSGWGGYAEYVCASENSLTLKPEKWTFEEAAATPQAGLLALQGLLNYGEIKSGLKILINGAGGGVGTFAIQIAKHYGAEVTGVDNSSKLDFMKSLGADHVIDYTKEDFTKNGKTYDIILDVKATRSLSKIRHSLRPKGKCFLIGGVMSKIFMAVFFGSLASKKVKLVLYKPNKDLQMLIDLIEAGKVKPIIDKSYSLSEVGKGIQYLGEGHAKGKIVIVVRK